VKRVLARISVAICGLAILLLLLSFEAEQTSPLRYVLDVLYTGALGINGYCAFKWLRALRASRQRAVLVVVGAVWLAILCGLLFMIAVVGFALGAGGGSSSRPPSVVEWLSSLAVWGIGAAFYFVLTHVRAATRSVA
jgi:hypothetical protein